MTLNTIYSTTPTSSAYLSARVDIKTGNSTGNGSSSSASTSFGQTLNSVSAASPTPQAIVTQNESIPFASFIDNIDFSKFKSDPLHFGQFIPIEAEAPPPAIEASSSATVPEIVKSTNTSLNSLLGSIEAQLNYVAPQIPSPNESTASSKNNDEAINVSTDDEVRKISDTSELKSFDQSFQSAYVTQYLANTDVSTSSLASALFNTDSNQDQTV